MDEKAIRPGGPRHRREPVVADQELQPQGSEYRQLLWVNALHRFGTAAHGKTVHRHWTVRITRRIVDLLVYILEFMARITRGHIGRGIAQGDHHARSRLIGLCLIDPTEARNTRV